MSKTNWNIIVNSAISLSMFGFIFYSYAGKSGGDLAIISLNVFFGLFQLLVNSIIARIKKNKPTEALIAIVLCQLLEFSVFLIGGYEINEWIKTFKI